MDPQKLRGQTIRISGTLRGLFLVVGILALPSVGILSGCAAKLKNPSVQRDGVVPLPQGVFSDKRYVEPPQDKDGDDRSLLPEQFPTGVWLPIMGPLGNGQIGVQASINDRVTVGVLDTGATISLMGESLAAELDLVSEYQPKGRPINARDAHGDLIRGELLPMESLQLGSHRFTQKSLLVVEKDFDLFLIGADVLRDLDIYLATDEGLVGLFAAGKSPRFPRASTVTLKRESDALFAKGGIPKEPDATFELLVDTGATTTSVPIMVGLNHLFPVDVRFETMTKAVSSVREMRGRFVLDPLLLGSNRVSVGKVLGLGATFSGGDHHGLLGNDVLSNHRTLISIHSQLMRLENRPHRPPYRRFSAGGKRCISEQKVIPCLKTGISKRTSLAPVGTMENIFVEVTAHENYGGRSLELLLNLRDPDGRELLAGGQLRVYTTVGPRGAHHSYDLPAQLSAFGVDENTQTELVWVRSKNFTWPCSPEQTECLTYTNLPGLRESASPLP